MEWLILRNWLISITWLLPASAPLGSEVEGKPRLLMTGFPKIVLGFSSTLVICRQCLSSRISSWIKQSKRSCKLLRMRSWRKSLPALTRQEGISFWNRGSANLGWVNWWMRQRRRPRSLLLTSSYKPTASTWRSWCGLTQIHSWAQNMSITWNWWNRNLAKKVPTNSQTSLIG